MTELTMESKHRPFKTETLTRNCNEILKRRRHVLIGISPFNSRFSEDYLQAGFAEMRLVKKGVFDFHPQTLVCGLVREIGKCMNGLGVAAMRFQRLFSESPVP